MPFAAAAHLREYRRRGVTARLLIGGSLLLSLTVGFALISLSFGPVEISVGDIAWIVVAASVGMALGVAGAAMQGLFRNPMADPGIIGVSAGGAVGAVIAIATGLTSLFALALPIFAFVGAMLATLLLAGVAVNATRSCAIYAAVTYLLWQRRNGSTALQESILAFLERILDPGREPFIGMRAAVAHKLPQLAHVNESWLIRLLPSVFPDPVRNPEHWSAA